MADEFGNVGEGGAGSELLGNKGVAQVVDFGSFDAGDSKETVNGGPNIADEEGVAGFGDEDSSFARFGANFEIDAEGI